MYGNIILVSTRSLHLTETLESTCSFCSPIAPSSRLGDMAWSGLPTLLSPCCIFPVIPSIAIAITIYNDRDAMRPDYLGQHLAKAYHVPRLVTLLEQALT